MGSYGRNVDFRVTPEEYMRRGRVVLSSAADGPIGAPYVVGTPYTKDAGYTDALVAKLATGAQNPNPGFTGIGIYEWIDYNGYDPALTTSGERDLIPKTKLFQLISGAGVKVVFKNTAAHTFVGARQYPGRNMVAGMGATPTVVIGDFLTPGTGNDSAGYWAVGTSTNGWLHVTNVDATRQEVEAEFVF